MIVAYRGLWDKFARPNSLEAFTRAYRKRVPFIVDLSWDDVSQKEIEQGVFWKQSMLPVYLKANDFPSIASWQESMRGRPNIFAILKEEAPAYPVYLHTEGGKWEKCGLYVPIETLLSRRRDFKGAPGELSFVLYESIDVIGQIEEMKKFANFNDGGSPDFLSERLGVRVPHFKVSDLVELEFLTMYP